jgi:hypothetical protein
MSAQMKQLFTFEPPIAISLTELYFDAPAGTGRIGRNIA